MSQTISRNTPFEQLPDVLTPEEVGLFLGISRSTAYEAIRRNEIPNRKIGRRLIVPKAGLRLWLEGDARALRVVKGGREAA